MGRHIRVTATRTRAYHEYLGTLLSVSINFKISSLGTDYTITFDCQFGSHL